MEITLQAIDETNREAVIGLSVREDQPFIANNQRSLEQAEETDDEMPGVARPFAVCADGRPVGFTMFAFDEEYEDPDSRYWLWRFMIDQNEQGKGYGQAAMAEIIRYFRENGADMILLSTKAENEAGLHLYHKFGFQETGGMNNDEIVLKLVLDP
jgi:diamine N-acetyltransferase